MSLRGPSARAGSGDSAPGGRGGGGGAGWRWPARRLGASAGPPGAGRRGVVGEEGPPCWRGPLSPAVLSAGTMGRRRERGPGRRAPGSPEKETRKSPPQTVIACDKVSPLLPAFLPPVPAAVGLRAHCTHRCWVSSLAPGCSAGAPRTGRPRPVAATRRSGRGGGECGRGAWGALERPHAGPSGSGLPPGPCLIRGAAASRPGPYDPLCPSRRLAGQAEPVTWAARRLRLPAISA